MNYGKKIERDRINLNAALAATGEYFRLDDYELDPAERDAMFEPEEQDHSGYDVEQFIYKLSHEELVVLLFKSLGTPSREIAIILNCGRSHVYKIIEDLGKKTKSGL
jgi:hypothetical protein